MKQGKFLPSTLRYSPIQQIFIKCLWVPGTVLGTGDAALRNFLKKGQIYVQINGNQTSILSIQRTLTLGYNVAWTTQTHTRLVLFPKTSPERVERKKKSHCY